MSPEEAENIREEERIRYAIRKELSKGDRNIWEILNSGIVLWLLSSVLLTGFAYVYSSVEATMARRAAAKRRAAECDSELNNRLRYFAQRMKALGKELQEERSHLDSDAVPEGWYQGIDNRWTEVQQSEFSSTPELRVMPVEQLLSSLLEAIIASGDSNPELIASIKTAKQEWADISQDCHFNYTTFDPRDLSPTGYYNLIAEIIDRTNERLSRGELRKWASLSKTYS